MESMNRPFHHDPVRYVTVTNGTSETVPPFALMKITGMGADDTLTIDKPDDDSTALLVNGVLPIPAGEKGQASFTFPAVVGCDQAGPNPEIGDKMGTVTGKWYLQKDGNGFEVMAVQPNADPVQMVLVDRMGTADDGGGGGGGGGGCCSDEVAVYDSVLYPFTTTCDIRRPFGAGAATTSNVSCSYWGDFANSRLSADAIDWTHVMVVPAGTDIRDGITRLLGSNALGYADGDEVRIPSGASSPRFVVVWVESVNKGGSNPYYRVFLMRHTA